MQNKSDRSQIRSPRWARILAVLAIVSVTLSACGSPDRQTAAESASVLSGVGDQNGVEYGASLDEWAEATTKSETESESSNGPTEGYEEISWEDLRPADNSSDEITARYQDRLAALEDGSAEAETIYAEMQAEYEANSDAMNSEFDGTKVKLAGFVAPLNSDEDIVTEFLLVPYFGACIHVPAPPAYQTILVNVDKANGLTMDETWGAVWVAGTLTVDYVSTDLAAASFTMTDALSGVYDDY